ncbi:MAG: hypothetical protein A3H52_02295 [Candidatus Zambryskibacteria bacterium RIFCSPLOWO2_02_FULL_39_26]|uniref:DUF378 domain-containing protein n=1 Tax=Candidatus Zambryskibacteria bacterium RIFCSPLOWO2_12_FULL_39_23 TaxID=1802776 RepID=A0A1G2UT51_9BACT|nr:MAG: hypothetical protein A2W51_00670 [Candidatus Zambryskibacteria bacterium RIFCSPHIGHO2_02_39_10]OHB09467.1 MAG: hypothetical protein A3H52_02295 [Candidatus Zambryskibacteria bacterium RIFCSPLOWO2_02_FULL_39_26]OHB12571.1 MAG: hypothetical protein A3G99_02000 [Candidatus Zambryskibacteria bacterium RIFCSPLOWO2_12_FULL_39_23]
MKSLHTITFILLIIGGLNWGLDALGYNVVDMLGSQIAVIVYLLVGLAALYEVFTHKNRCKNCMSGGQQI